MAGFRVLGPLAVEGDGAGSPLLRAQMVRRLLAALLCKPNAVVSVDDLLTALWGDQAPATARKTLQVYVRRLRTALGDDHQITHEGGGYRIVVTADRLDSARFAQLVAEANGLKSVRQAELLGQALELWHGSAFEDVREHAPIADEARRLDEERLRVESRLTELQLELGRHADLVPHLTKLVDAHPYREDFRAHLMLALYRCGRQTEALELFRGTRRLLDEELGVEPGPELQRLHEAILRADATLNLASSRAVTVPRELPADISGFVGRDAQLCALDGMLPDSSPVLISAIAGSAGVGKTALAVHWAHRVADEFPDGQLYVNLQGFDPAGHPVAPADAIRRFLDALAIAPQRIPVGLEAQTALYRTLLAGKRVLVVLDNARDAEQVRPLLPGSPTCLVVVTSRNRLTSLIATNSARPLMLDVLTTDEARHLLVTRLGHSRVADEPAAIDEIITRCVRLPLALAIAAARAVSKPEMSLAALAADLADARNQLDALEGDDDPATDLRAVFSWSYEQLGPEPARLFRLLGLHPGPDISAQAAASLAGLAPRDVQPLLDDLTKAHLLAEHARGRYMFHDLLRTYAAELGHIHNTESERQAALRRMLDHYLHTAYKAERLLDPSREPLTLDAPLPAVTPESMADHDEAMVWLTAELQVLLNIMRLAPSAGFDRHTCQLTFAVRGFFDKQGHWDSWVAVQRTALEAANRLSDQRMQAIACTGLSIAYTRLGRYEDGYTYREQALDLYAQLGDRSGQAYAHMGLGWVLGLQGRHADALSHTRQALDMFQCASHRVGEAYALNGIGWYHAQLHEHHLALTHCQQALQLLKELGDRIGEADTWDSIGLVHHNLGSHAEAIACYDKAIHLYSDLGHRSYEAETLSRLGDSHCTAGDDEAAHEAWKQALAIYIELDHREADHVRSKLEGVP